MNFRYSQAMLNWFEACLKERFNHDFIIQTYPNGIITLSILDSCDFISFTSDVVTFSRADSDLPFTQWDAISDGWESALGTPIPAPGANNLPIPLITLTTQGMHVAYDIIGLTYWMLSRQEEVGRIDLDQHGRFPATSSHALKHNYLERPVVDEWLHILEQVILRLWPSVKLKKKSFSIKVSHDVDVPSLYAFKSWRMISRMMAGHLLKRADFHSFLTAPILKFTSRNNISPKDIFNTFDWIMDLSDRYGLISSFYFISAATEPRDADYKIEDPRIRTLMQRIHHRGHEIGLHPSYGSYKKSKLICEEFDRLRRVCSEEGIHQNKWGSRMHYLRWEQPTSLSALVDAGIDYDGTLGYADRPGFRCGTCFEYPAFDPIKQRALPLRIRPLIVMECSIISEAYLSLSIGSLAINKALTLKKACKSVNGSFTLLWHNSELNSESKKNMYTQILDF